MFFKFDAKVEQIQDINVVESIFILAKSDN